MIYEKIKSIAVYGVGGAVALGFLWLILKFALPVALPFLLAYALACALRIGASKLSRKTHMNENILRGILLALGIILIGLFIWFGASAVFREVREALGSLSNMLGGASDLTDAAGSLIRGIGERLGLSKELQEAATGLALGAGERISTFLASGAADLISVLPRLIFASAVGGVSLLYFTFAYEHTAEAVKSVLPSAHRENICKTAKAVVRGLGRFARAYAILISITTAELLCGFLILRIEHAFILALFISIVDILPVLGVGTVLLPWAAFSLLSDDILRAVGLLILLAVIGILRHPIESRLVGKSAGVHAVIALMATYTGYFIAGVFGMITAPLVLGAAAAIRAEGIK